MSDGNMRCAICNENKPKAGETYNGKPLCQDCIDALVGKGESDERKTKAE